MIWLTGTTPGPGNIMIDAATFPNTPKRLVHQIDAILASVVAPRGCWNC
jgi:hypothetical protein